MLEKYYTFTICKSLNYPISKILYVSCDHPAMSGYHYMILLKHFMQEVENFLLLMKYIKMKIFQKILKAIYDVFDLQVLFSGSSALQIENSSADLSRRAVIHTLGVLSLREFCELQTNQTFQSYSLEDILKITKILLLKF